MNTRSPNNYMDHFLYDQTLTVRQYQLYSSIIGECFALKVIVHLGFTGKVFHLSCFCLHLSSHFNTAYHWYISHTTDYRKDRGGRGRGGMKGQNSIKKKNDTVLWQA